MRCLASRGVRGAGRAFWPALLRCLLLCALPLACVEEGPRPRPTAPRPSARQVTAAPAAASSTAPLASSDPLAESAAPAEEAAPAPPPDNRPRIGSVRWLTTIWPTPEHPKDALPIGSIRYGTSIPLKSKEPVVAPGCDTKWYAVEPVGYVCADDTTKLDMNDPYFKALASVTPGPGPWPYRYAFSTGAPMYTRVPTKAEQEAAEHDLGPIRTFKSLGKWSEGHERLLATDPADAIKATDPIPDFFKNHQGAPGSPWNPAAKPNIRFVPNGSGISYSKAFEAEGRVWLLTPELFIVPADRVFLFKRSYFKGVELKGEMELPIAWVRGDAAKKQKRTESGAFEVTSDAWTGKVAVPLTGKEAKIGKAIYHETKESGLWIAEGNEVSMVNPVDKLPKTVGPDEKWIDARLLPGTMVAYVGLKPVFATLWSPGKGGVPVPGGDPKRDATTELGTFSFQWKDKVATMSPDKGAVTVFWFADVPNIQYVHAPLAMHVSYWHPDFGFLRSAECLNLSPIDGEWMFNWTLPTLPEGWGSVRPSKLMGPSTKLVIRPR